MDEIEEIKRRIDIIDLISNYLTLKKAGANYKAICPFHQEKTPSMMISGEKQIFKCFGCGEGGDILTFVMKMENLEFREALELLAERAGVKLAHRDPRQAQEQTDRKTRLYKINDYSAKIFQKILLSHPLGKPALNYLKNRKLTTETIKTFGIGYAPSPRALRSFLAKKGFSAQELVDAGNPDRFFKRIMFPIRDTMGHTIGFTGRVTEKDQEPKYLNTADTIIFHKGRLLYNLDQSKVAIKQENVAIVVEGQMDVIASFQSGVKNVVATSGTALTDEHLQIIYRYTPNIIFAFDSDAAGLNTAKKAFEQAIAEKMNVKMVELGPYKDPGEMIAENPELWRKAVKNAKPVVEWYFNLAFNRYPKKEEHTGQEKKEIAKELLPIIKLIPDTIEQAHYVAILAKRLDVKEEIIFQAISKLENKDIKTQTPPKKDNLSSQSLLLGLLIRKPQRIGEVKDVDERDFVDSSQKKIYNLLLKEYNHNKNMDLKSLLGKIDRGLKNEINILALRVDDLYKNEDPEKENEDFKELLTNFAKNRRELLKEHFASEIGKAEKNRDLEKLKALMKEFQNAISKEN